MVKLIWSFLFAVLGTHCTAMWVGHRSSYTHISLFLIPLSPPPPPQHTVMVTHMAFRPRSPGHRNSINEEISLSHSINKGREVCACVLAWICVAIPFP